MAELSGKSINSYFSHFESNLKELSQEVLEENGTLNINHARLLLKRFRENNPEFANITIIYPDGQALASSVMTLGTPLPNLGLENSLTLGREALLKGQVFDIGQPNYGKIIKEWIIPLRYGVPE